MAKIQVRQREWSLYFLEEIEEFNHWFTENNSQFFYRQVTKNTAAIIEIDHKKPIPWSDFILVEASNKRESKSIIKAEYAFWNNDPRIGYVRVDLQYETIENEHFVREFNTIAKELYKLGLPFNENVRIVKEKCQIDK